MTELEAAVARLQRWCITAVHSPEDERDEPEITIVALDDPGWMLTLDNKEVAMLTATGLPLSVHRSEADWIKATLKGNVLQAIGGAGNLRELLILAAAALPADEQAP